MERIVYLTFDDGPDEFTEKILDLLNEYDIKATFFNIGSQERKYPELVKRIVKEGHTLGNHTWSHNPNLYKDPESFIEEVRRVKDYQEELTGRKLDKIFRFPFGSDKASEKCRQALINDGYTYVDWNVYLQDGRRNPSPEKAYDLAINGVENCKEIPVILTHAERPGKSGPQKALESIIGELKSKGYIFKTVKEGDQLVHL